MKLSRRDFPVNSAFLRKVQFHYQIFQALHGVAVMWANALHFPTTMHLPSHTLQI